MSDFLLTLNLNKSVREREREEEALAGASALRKAKKNTYCNNKNTRLKVNPGTDNAIGQSFRVKLNRI